MNQVSIGLEKMAIGSKEIAYGANKKCDIWCSK